jgi:transcriptional regulator with XRE-family HTH domain
MTQAALAKRAGLSRLSIHYLESGRHRTVRSDNLVRLSKALGVSSSELLGAS